MSTNLDELLDQLKSDTNLTAVESGSARQLDLSDENINDFVLQHTGKLVEGGVDTVNALKELILASTEPHEITAFSELFRAVTGALDTLNRVNIQNKKDQTTKEVKQMDIEARKQLPTGNQSGDTNILIATREEVIQQFLEQNKDDIIDVESEEVVDEQE